MSGRGAGEAAVRVAVDVGGTFTDVVLERAERRTTVKVLTTPSAPEEGVIEGMRRALASAGVGAGAVGLVLHGTTLATNAILERKGARTALLTTAGFRDVLEIGYESRFDQYDVQIEKPVPLVPRELRLPVPERVDVAGNVLEALDEDAVRALVPVLERSGVESVAVGFLHAYGNAAHEERVRELLAGALPAVSVSLSSEVCPEIREYERISTTVANAYVRPRMATYLGRLGGGLREIGLECPVLLMTSGGGLASIETAMRFPIRLVESGPAGGAILASALARELGLARAMAFDMGGTTAKICLIDGGEPRSAREFEVDRSARFLKGSGLPLRIPVIEMVEIGAGGGSIAHIDALGRIAVGPQSAGADPGPAAYARGGEAATVTDADLELGRIDPARFAGGKVALAPERAAAALERTIGRRLGVVTAVAAFGVSEMVEETMANAARVHAVEQGKAAGDYALIAFGGAAPLHAARLAEKLGIERVVVPAHAGVGSAIGMLRAPVAYEVVRSRTMRLARFDPEAVNPVIAAMRAEARAVVEAGAPEAEVREARGAYMRYVGQGHEIYVEVPPRRLLPEDRQTLQAAFDREYARLYRRTIPQAEVEVLTWSVSLAAAAPPVGRSEPAATRPAAPPGASRRVVDPETAEPRAVAVYWRPDLGPGERLSGPAVIAEEETSTYVTAGFDAHVTSGGHLVLERRREAPPEAGGGEAPPGRG